MCQWRIEGIGVHFWQLHKVFDLISLSFIITVIGGRKDSVISMNVLTLFFNLKGPFCILNWKNVAAKLMTHR